MMDGDGNQSDVCRHPRRVFGFPAHLSRLALSFGWPTGRLRLYSSYPIVDILLGLP